MKEYLNLMDLQARLRSGVERDFPSRLWVKAEISSIKARQGGHCYLELSQSVDGMLVAKVRAVIWSGTYRMVSACFMEVTGSRLSEGMQVLFEVQVTYSELYGLSLVVWDVDPEFTLGNREMEKRRTVERLVSEGLVDMQRSLCLSRLPYRIGVVSAPDAAGFRDFCRHLEENEYGFSFDVRLFPALMQGPDCPSSIISAMNMILDCGESFDVVMLIRGGGGNLDLSCFDDYSLAAAVARYPIPVMCAIGHDQDYHVCDMVAYDQVKTPTALADRMVGMFRDEDEHISAYVSRLKMAFLSKISAMESRVAVLESRVLSSDPRNILARGYVLALDASGRVMKSASSALPGEHMYVMFADGTVESVIKDVKK